MTHEIRGLGKTRTHDVHEGKDGRNDGFKGAYSGILGAIHHYWQLLDPPFRTPKKGPKRGSKKGPKMVIWRVSNPGIWRPGPDPEVTRDAKHVGLLTSRGDT